MPTSGTRADGATDEEIRTPWRCLGTLPDRAGSNCNRQGEWWHCREHPEDPQRSVSHCLGCHVKKTTLLIDGDILAFRSVSVNYHEIEWEPDLWTYHVDMAGAKGAMRGLVDKLKDPGGTG